MSEEREQTPCPFCEIIAGRAPGVMPTRWDDAVVIEPLNPVTEGHVLIVPRSHVRDVAENRWASTGLMARVAEYLQVGPYPGVEPVGPCNVITSCGKEATQTVMHLHVHVVPRKADDGLTLPWSTPAAESQRDTLRTALIEAQSWIENGSDGFPAVERLLARIREALEGTS